MMRKKMKQKKRKVVLKMREVLGIPLREVDKLNDMATEITLRNLEKKGYRILWRRKEKPFLWKFGAEPPPEKVEKYGCQYAEAVTGMITIPVWDKKEEKIKRLFVDLMTKEELEKAISSDRYLLYFGQIEFSSELERERILSEIIEQLEMKIRKQGL